MGFALPSARAQSSACTADENVVTFVFSTTTSTNASGGTATWTAAAVGPASVRVGTTTAGGITANTITFTASIDGGVAWAAPGGTAPNAPRLAQYGNLNNTLALAMDATTTSVGTHLTLTFNRPMDKVQFVMTDVDYSAGQWQDVLRATGYLNGNAVVAPVFTAVVPGDYAIATNTPAAGTTQATANTGTGAPNCAVTSNQCNITVGFANPVDAIRIDFLSGTTIANPASQVVGFQNFSYCVPKRELSLSKVDTTPTFIAGGTGTYTLTITNQGGTQTAAANPILVQDILPAGLSFINPQAPGGGWTCTLATTSQPDDTANCSRGTTVLAGNGASTVLTLTAAVSPFITATSVDNRAKVAGGGDPNKAAIATTGAVSACNAANEGWDGGGSLYASGGSTNAGCAFENTAITHRALLAISKTNNATSVTSGATTNYVITITNQGPSYAPGTLLTDTYVAGLNCSTPSFVSTPSGSVTTSPTVVTIGALQGGGISLQTFPANSTATFTVPCTVTATGQLTPWMFDAPTLAALDPGLWAAPGGQAAAPVAPAGKAFQPAWRLKRLPAHPLSG